MNLKLIKILSNATAAVFFLLCHTVITSALIGCIFLAQQLIVWGRDPLLFDAVPLRYAFDAMDVGILVSYVIIGTLGAIAAFKEEPSDEH